MSAPMLICADRLFLPIDNRSRHGRLRFLRANRREVLDTIESIVRTVKLPVA
jgi:hypothetical protein